VKAVPVPRRDPVRAGPGEDPRASRTDERSNAAPRD